MKNRFFIFIVLLILSTSISFSNPAQAEPTKNQHYRVPRVDSKIKPDGILDEEAWKKAVVIQLNYEVQPGENIKPPVETEVLLAYNKTHLFIAFRAYDPEPDKIRARMSDRDDLGNQDWVGVILDTFNDKRRSFDLLCNPLGMQTDFIEISSGSGGDGEWDAIWDSGGHINQHGYFVEMSVPFSSLRFQRREGDQVWSFDAVRSYPRRVRHHIGVFPRDRSNNCYLCQSVKLVGFEGAIPGKNLEFDPTLVGHIARQREDDNQGPFIENKKVEPGITARWGFTPNLTLSAAVNPDFSQVEADALQLDINEPFALFYSEKRPFFQEGSDFFSSRLNAVYTRTLRNPSWGVKLTGKEKGNTIGAYMVRDTLTNLIFPGSQSSDSTSLSLDSTATVLRYRRDLGNKYTIGTLFTNRQGDEYFNRLLSFDSDFRVTNKDRIMFQVMGSSTRYPEEVALEFDQQQGKFNDRAFDLFYSHNTRTLDWYAGYRDIGPDFRADLGFIPQVGYRSVSAGSYYTWYAQPGQWWTAFVLEGSYSQMTDDQGDLLNRSAIAALSYEGPLETHALAMFTAKREVYNGVTFDQQRYLLHNCMNPMATMHTGWTIEWGDNIDYANTRLGKRLNIRANMLYDIGLHLQLNLSHTFEHMRVNAQHLYTANQSELHLTYQFNKRMFLRGILQYVDYQYNTAMYIDEIDPLYRHLFTQILLSYKINPQTVVFLGYTDNYRGYDHTGLPLADRKFFLKIGYALVM